MQDAPEEPYKLTLQCYVTRWLCSNMTSSIAPSMQFSPTKQSHWLTDPFEIASYGRPCPYLAGRHQIPLRLVTLVLGPWLHLGFLSANNAASLDQIHSIIPLPSASHPPSVQMEAWVYTSTLRSAFANQASQHLASAVLGNGHGVDRGPHAPSSGFSSVLRDTVHNPAPLTPEDWARARNGVLKTDGSQPSSAPHPSEQQQPTTATPSPGDSSGVDK
ncbi:hypothetical protein VTJ04DRAFT_8878 [Mycothermus thermophilus]|uniref:uncharacterized protein n=1 Tax=Humicola insolens TaxID=85995 RepID=UPI0037423171